MKNHRRAPRTVELEVLVDGDRGEVKCIVTCSTGGDVYSIAGVTDNGAPMVLTQEEHDAAYEKTGEAWEEHLEAAREDALERSYD